MHLQRRYLVENLTGIVQILTGLGDEGSGNCLVFEPGEKKLIKLVIVQYQIIRYMGQFKITGIKGRAE